MRAVSISGTCGRFLRSYMRSYMFTYMLRIFISKSEGVGCDVVVLWIFLWCFSGFLLAFLSSLKWYGNLYGCLSFYNKYLIVLNLHCLYCRVCCLTSQVNPLTSSSLWAHSLLFGITWTPKCPWAQSDFADYYSLLLRNALHSQVLTG